MSHARQQIREALVATLTGLATTGASVFINRARAVAAGDLPALVVRVLGEQIAEVTFDWPPLLDRAVEIEVEALASGTAAADTLDTICSEIEAALHASESAATAGGLLNAKLKIAGLDFQFDDESSPPLGAMTLKFRGEYATRANAPDTAL